MKRAAVLLVLLAACQSRQERPEPMKPLGDAAHGKVLVVDYGCNVCHIIPGIPGPQGSLGPSLEGVGARPTISYGKVANTPANLAKYLANPQSLNPQSTMPALGLQGNDAGDIAAYLYTLR
jgi:cytochrome c2